MALKIRSIVLVLLAAVLLLSCQSAVQGLKPGDKLGDMVLRNVPEEDHRAKFVSQPFFRSYCDPHITSSDPPVLEETCEIPWNPTLFLGWGQVGSTMDEVEAKWQRLSFEYYLDGQQIDLPAFGTINTEFDQQYYRWWDVMVENPTPGVHSSHWVILDADSGEKKREMTWEFTMGEK